MQPYFFPYIGYFQLIAASNQFIYRDDVQFIERGWIHRNRLLIEGKAKYLTIPCRKGSKYQLIYKVEHAMDYASRLRREYLVHLIKSYYQGAPFFDFVFPLIEQVMYYNSPYVADLAIQSVIKTCRYIGIEPPCLRASEIVEDSNSGCVQGVIDICNQFKADLYINTPGGKKLYQQSDFMPHGVGLEFLESPKVYYPQFGEPFVADLSIIDVMMFNAPGHIKEMICQYRTEESM